MSKSTKNTARAYPYARPGSYVLLTVSDTGRGNGCRNSGTRLEPFFTTKEVGKGTGLGLATVYGIVKQHGGLFICIASRERARHFESISRLEAACPYHVNQKMTTKDQRHGNNFAGRRQRRLREAAYEMLQILGYRVILATNGAEATEVLKANCGRIDLAILDVVMPGLSGPAAYSQMAAFQPDLRVIFATGYTAETVSLNSTLEKGNSHPAKALQSEKSRPNREKHVGLPPLHLNLPTTRA